MQMKSVISVRCNLRRVRPFDAQVFRRSEWTRSSRQRVVLLILAGMDGFRNCGVTMSKPMSWQEGAADTALNHGRGVLIRPRSRRESLLSAYRQWHNSRSGTALVAPRRSSLFRSHPNLVLALKDAFFPQRAWVRYNRAPRDSTGCAIPSPPSLPVPALICQFDPAAFHSSRNSTTEALIDLDLDSQNPLWPCRQLSQGSALIAQRSRRRQLASLVPSLPATPAIRDRPVAFQ